jgi:hypothetical protein
VAFGEYLGMKSGHGWVIHHKDGNPLNDHPSNLENMTIREHWEIHYDWKNCKIESGVCHDKAIPIIKESKKKENEKRQKVLLNHKVVKVEWLNERVDCGDITIENYHNFAVDAGIFIHNSNKNALALESFMFAETINSYQHTYSKYLYSLFNKIYKFVKSEKLPKEITITFPPPKFLRLEKEAEYAEAITRILNSYTQFDIPKEYILKRYLSEDWEEIEDSKIKEKIDQRLDPSKQQIDPATGMPMNQPPGMGGGMNFGGPSGF